VANYTTRTVVLRDGSVVSDRPVEGRGRAAGDLEAWKQAHSLIAPEAEEEAAS
jgi:hypothetical protein